MNGTDRHLITGGDPEEPCGVPDKSLCDQLDFLPDKRLEEVGEALILRKFPDLDGVTTVTFLWKSRGGASGGNRTLGKCVKNSGLVRHYSNHTDYTVWVAADHLRQLRFTRYELEALLYHELCHIAFEEPEEEGDRAVVGTRGYDVEAFYAEIREYGLWRANLQLLSDVIQPALPLAMT